MMSQKKKVLTILHLCFAFTYFFWLVLQPYVKEVLARKSEVSLFERVYEQKKLFEQLPSQEQHMLLEGYENAQNSHNPSFLKEIGFLFFVKTSPFALAWLFFSLAVCLLLLFGIEGAKQVIWILPLLIVAYAYFSYTTPRPKPLLFFPSEEYVIAHYVDEQDNGLLKRQKKLLEGWHRYLIAEWAHEEPNQHGDIFEEQLTRGLFAFNVERLKWIFSGKEDEIILAGFTFPPSFLRFLCYFFWNLFFAWFINNQSKAASSPS